MINERSEMKMNDSMIFLTISEQIKNSIKERIVNGELTENTPLREQELSTEFGISRGPVRDALKELTKEGFLVAKPNAGVRVAYRPKEDVLDLVIHLRKEIEGFVIEHIIETITDDDIAHLENILDQMKKACQEDNINTVEILDNRFHKYLVEHYKDTHLLELWMFIGNCMVYRYDRFNDLMGSYMEHQNILEAIKKKDKKQTIELLNTNIQ